jgi:DNA polymerase III sliding clamp (beta) subunit (PCNA family)
MTKIVVKSRDLLTGIQKVAYARSKDKDLKNKPLSGICLSIRKDKLNLAAANGHRLALYSIPVDALETAEVIITEKTTKEIVKKVKKKETIEIEISDDKLIIDGLQYDVLQGKYPNYEGLYPKDGFDVEIVVSKRELLDSINKVVKERPLKGESGRYDVIKLTLLNDAKKLTITARDHTFESEDLYNSVEIDADIKFNYFFYEDFVIYFNDKYVQQAVEPIESDNVIIRFLKVYDETCQTEFTDGFNYSALVMPMRGWA